MLQSVVRRVLLVICICVCGCGSSLFAQDFHGLKIHGFATQGVLYSSNNNYLTTDSSSGSFRWTDGAVSVTDSLTDNLRLGIQLHMYQLGQLGGPDLEVDWVSADYKFNDFLGFRAGKVKTVLGLFNDSQDVDAIFLWTLLPQGSYPIDNKSFFLSHTGGDAYGTIGLGRRAGKLRYTGYVGKSTLDLDGGFVKQASQYGLDFKTGPAGLTYGGDLRWDSFVKGLTMGTSVDVEDEDGRAPQGSEHISPFHITAQYAQFSIGKLYLAGEYKRDPLNLILKLGPAVIPVPVDERIWFAMASYRIFRRAQAGTYYSHYVNKSMNTALPANYSKDFVISGRYDFNAYFYGKIEGHFLHGTGLGYYNDTNPGGLKTNSCMLAAKIGFSF